MNDQILLAEETWERLAQDQVCADKRGFGSEWKRMCEERTQEAFYAARRAQLRSCNLAPVMNWKPAEKRE
jgi:hypothetical protein